MLLGVVSKLFVRSICKTSAGTRLSRGRPVHSVRGFSLLVLALVLAFVCAACSPSASTSAEAERRRESVPSRPQTPLAEEVRAAIPARQDSLVGTITVSDPHTVIIKLNQDRFLVGDRAYGIPEELMKRFPELKSVQVFDADGELLTSRVYRGPAKAKAAPAQ